MAVAGCAYQMHVMNYAEESRRRNRGEGEGVEADNYSFMDLPGADSGVKVGIPVFILFFLDFCFFFSLRSWGRCFHPRGCIFWDDTTVCLGT